MSVTMRQMLEAGVHFGHQTRFWNPKMAPFIFGHRNKIHIINLERTLEQFHDGDQVRPPARPAIAARSCSSAPSARRARSIVEEAQRAGMPFVDQRWLGGMLTNFKTVKVSIKRLKEMEQIVADNGPERMSKKEALDFQREIDKHNKAIGGIKDMNALPDALFVIDVGYHKIAILEAAKLGIPVVGRGRYQSFAGRHRVRDSGQRRLEPRRATVRARHRRCRARGQGGRAARCGQQRPASRRGQRRKSSSEVNGAQ